MALCALPCQIVAMLWRATLTGFGAGWPTTGPMLCFGTGVVWRWRERLDKPRDWAQTRSIAGQTEGGAAAVAFSQDRRSAAPPLRLKETALPSLWTSSICAVLLAFHLLPSVAAQEFCVEGTVKRLAYLGGQTYRGPNSSFSMNVNGCNWFVRARKDQGKYGSDYEEVSYDGTNVYVLLNNKSDVEKQLQMGAKLGPDIAAAKVYRGEVCNLFEVEEVGPIWLTYASGCYFKSRTNDFVEAAIMQDPISGVQFGPPTHSKMRAHWTLSDSNPSFPVRVDYYSEGHVMVRGKAVSLPRPYDAGLTSAVYQAGAFTNYLGLDIPLTSSLKIFKMRTNAVANTDLDLIIEFHVELTNVAQRAASFISQPRIPGITLVKDFRDSRGGVLVYYATNNWPTETEILTGSYFEEIRRLNTSPHVPGGALPSVVRVVLILLVFVPAMIYLVNKHLARKRRTPTQI